MTEEVRTPYPSAKLIIVDRVVIHTEGGSWDFEIGGKIQDPDEFDWTIISIEAYQSSTEVSE